MAAQDIACRWAKEHSWVIRGSDWKEVCKHCGRLPLALIAWYFLAAALSCSSQILIGVVVAGESAFLAGAFLLLGIAGNTAAASIFAGVLTDRALARRPMRWPRKDS